MDGNRANSYQISCEQVVWLKQELSSSDQRTLVIVHHPLWYPGLSTTPSNDTLKYDWMSKIHPMLNGRVPFVFVGNGGARGGYLFYEKWDEIYYYVNGSGLGGTSFLHVEADASDIRVLPHFLDIQTRGQKRKDPSSKFCNPDEEPVAESLILGRKRGCHRLDKAPRRSGHDLVVGELTVVTNLKQDSILARNPIV